MPRPCLFLDRDGVLIEDLGYVSRVEDLHPIPGSLAAVARARAGGVAVVVVTNQSGIGRGYYTETEFRAVQGALEERLRAVGGALDGVYFCASCADDHPDRKPNPGMLLRAAADLDLDLRRSLMVGDKLRDLLAGARAGVPRVCLVRTGEGAEESKIVQPGQVRPAELWVCADLAEAVAKFLALIAKPQSDR